MLPYTCRTHGYTDSFLEKSSFLRKPGLTPFALKQRPQKKEKRETWLVVGLLPGVEVKQEEDNKEKK